MSTQSTENSSSKEAKCLDCGKTLFRPGDLRRHRKTQHPDGTEFKFHCPFSDCPHKTSEKSNLKTHMNSRHSIVSGIICPTCNKAFPDLPARIRHRKKVHGYKPHHTPQYLAKRALKEAEKERGKAALSKTHDYQAASVVSSDTQNSSSSTDNISNSESLANVAYHDDFWKLLPDAPYRGASELKVSQISVPVSVLPAHDTPNIFHSNSDLYLPNVGQQPSTTQERDVTFFLGTPLDTTVQPQSQTLASSWTAYDQIPGVASDYRPFAATFPASEGQSTYPGMGFQSLAALSFPDVPLVMPNLFNSPATSTASSSRISEFVFPSHVATPPIVQPVPVLGWAPSLPLAESTPLSKTEFSTGGAKRGFNTWHDFA